MKIKWKSHRGNIPKSLDVNKASYEVVYVDGFKNPKVLGETRWNPKQIAIKNGESDKETVLTTFHELVHAISHEYDVRLTETQVLALEKAYIDFFKFFKQLEGTMK